MNTFSLNLQKLEEMATEVDAAGGRFRDQYEPKIAYLQISGSDLPVFDGGFHASYERMRQEMAEATKALRDALADIGGALKTVVTTYEKGEEAKGASFDTLLPS